MPKTSPGTASEDLGVKIDIEGFESDLFASDTVRIDDAFVVIIEPHDWMMPGKGTGRSCRQELRRRDFELFLRGENILYVRRTATPG